MTSRCAVDRQINVSYGVQGIREVSRVKATEPVHTSVHRHQTTAGNSRTNPDSCGPGRMYENTVQFPRVTIDPDCPRSRHRENTESEHFWRCY